MHSFPGFLNLQDRLVLVAGGGEHAARKIRLLLKAGDQLAFGVIQGGTRYYISV